MGVLDYENRYVEVALGPELGPSVECPVTQFSCPGVGETLLGRVIK